MDWLFGHVKWIFSGIGVAILGWLFIYRGNKQNQKGGNGSTNIQVGGDLPQELLVEHDLNEEFVRLPISNKNIISSNQFSIIANYHGKPSVFQFFSEEQKAAFYSIYELYVQDNNVKQTNIETFMKEWDKKTNLKILKDWWNSLSISFTVTSVGKVLAHSNAQRCESKLPPLN